MKASRSCRLETTSFTSSDWDLLIFVYCYCLVNSVYSKTKIELMKSIHFFHKKGVEMQQQTAKVSLALYSLVLFYHVFAKELAPHNPLSKFLCVKGVVFFYYRVHLKDMNCED
ncbi:hypothetical protein POM88_023521 [Heracleum sosnowskyi]|uniref:Uncharacterized protein n=1 Tax=Heracleum sosnowskyi TaxID=360622 RepID=A0AAD8MUK0_9APIA|nr:hypothetical protein POM88_023521 [Heracleum sosnowskyi]